MTIFEYKKQLLDIVKSMEEEHGSVKSIEVSTKEYKFSDNVHEVEIVFGRN